MKTMTLDEVKRLPPLSAEEIEKAMNFKNTDFSDCPKQTKEDLSKFRPWYEVQRYYKPVKKTVTLRLDADVLASLKNFGKGYQTKINEILRAYVFG